ncbi:hypothetical protein [Alkalimonas amylolytica]|uniref:Uncharacterized protein n=1 Tax=Alkalimonas amylolytica TaxID=152573 RepID=A0A1H4DBM8_ALKAM|nr:hypothetical protein [Alkalimonas amylolytica]SEA69916.1 hypothetical protein SAMN04488051_105161 [Alkalimonas amylolytica]
MSKTHLKLPVTGILALLMTGCGLMSSSSVAQVHENALVCENCNYVQAQQLAMQHAVPDLQCVIVGGGDVVNIDNQSCTSQPKHIVVFNAQSREAYPFEVYHAPQGVNPFEMQLHTRDRTVHPEIIAMLNTGVDEHAAFMAEAMQNAVQAGMAALQTQPLRHPSSLAIAPAALIPMASNCANDRDAAAVQLAFDTRKIASVQQYVQNEFRDNQATGIQRIKNALNFNEVRLDALSFGLSRAGFAANASLIITPETKHFTVVFNEAEDLRFFERLGVSNYPGYPQLVFNIMSRSQGGVVVGLDQDYSYIDGQALSTLTNIANSNVPIELSYCVAERLQQLNPNLHLSPPTPVGGSEGTPGGGGVGGGTGINECAVFLRRGPTGDTVVVGIIYVPC